MECGSDEGGMSKRAREVGDVVVATTIGDDGEKLPALGDSFRQHGGQYFREADEGDELLTCGRFDAGSDWFGMAGHEVI